MNSHRFIEEENKLLKERIRVLEDLLEEALDSISLVHSPITYSKVKEALTPTKKDE